MTPLLVQAGSRTSSVTRRHVNVPAVQMPPHPYKKNMKTKASRTNCCFRWTLITHYDKTTAGGTVVSWSVVLAYECVIVAHERFKLRQQRSNSKWAFHIAMRTTSSSSSNHWNGEGRGGIVM